MPDAIADAILLKFVLEHIGQSVGAFNGIMRELYRVAKPGAVSEIQAVIRGTATFSTTRPAFADQMASTPDIADHAFSRSWRWHN